MALEENNIEEIDDLETELDNSEGNPEESTDAPEVEEVEIVLDGDDGSQPVQKNTGIRNRVNKLNAKVSQAKEGEAQANNELEIERQKNKLLELALQQRSEEKPVVGPPDPVDFNGGASDPKYVAALNGYNREFIRAEMAKNAPAEVQAPVNSDLEAAQTLHYETADKLGVKDYDEVESRAIAILGKEVVNILIKSSPNSARILYFLGKNPERARDISETVNAEPARVLMELGVLGAGLTVQPKTVRKQAPDPDDDRQGSPSRRTLHGGPAGATYE